ncbi:site-specific DNA-methyltransferase [Pseudanabaena sp. FACHB-1998]|uniref:site-specific DNA-methyltransferase n=1 Tax=Pseudanabaena sp. FACHB-1998 TaxID=2692858 RepID=UPI0016819DB2|nr:site-specific DNA-methyltransferase [Pseudanabaena sp. FACHB-1998]MBD2178385.1 site-specific DNA-methyltransferase [Pseudanabaena sp. FACHB-1998]
MNRLYFGDNLQVLRESINSESIDLVYLDPPFNSNADYNVILDGCKLGDASPQLQIKAFEDRWYWSDQSARTLQALHDVNGDLAELLDLLVRHLRHNDLSAYLVMMAIRLVELHRVLKPTGSLYLHCDPTASHYLKIILDSIFGEVNYRSHITWKRSDTHNDAKHQYSAISDHILFYVKSQKVTFNTQYTEHSARILKDWYLYLDLPDGTTRKMTKEEIEFQLIPEGARRFNTGDMTSPNPRPNLMYDYKGYPYPLKGWRYSFKTMEKLDNEGKLLYPKSPSGRIMLKRYLDEQKGSVLGDNWTDISPLRATDTERLGYPTQKPLALLERIIQASSNEGDIVLDPFCGCGTALHAAQKLNRNWIGIDITNLAISLIEIRLISAFPQIEFEVFGTPSSVKSLINQTSHAYTNLLA